MGGYNVTLSFREFMEDVRQRLKGFSQEDLQDLILGWASEEPPFGRQEFLYKLTVPVGKQDVDEGTLMDEIEAFTQRVKNGDYCDGWGWDDAIYDERDWGDESWAEEMDEFFLQARSLLLQEEYPLAVEAYRKLFDILALGEEPGHLPGDPDSASMLTVDLNEQVALYLRAVYLSTPFQERATAFYEGMRRCRYLAREINLKNVVDALDSTLPDYEEFLAAWLDFLADQPHIHAQVPFGSLFSFDTGKLLREAVFLKGGIPALAEFARQHGDRHPQAFLDWIQALGMEADTDTLLRVARDGLSRIPRDHKVRAQVAETISRVGEKLHDHELKLEGVRESFYSNPSLGYLLDLYLTAMECGRFEEIRDETEQRTMELLAAKKNPAGNALQSRDQAASSASEGLFAHTLLLGGRLEQVCEMCKEKGPLGWSSRENPCAVLVTFLLLVLSKENVHVKMISKQREEAIRNTNYYVGEDYLKKYQQVSGVIKESIQLSEEQDEFYLEWCIDVIGRRVDAIVSNKHRKSYDKAAELLVAMAETLANRGEIDQGRELIERYRSKYSRHTAFKSELARALSF